MAILKATHIILRHKRLITFQLMRFLHLNCKARKSFMQIPLFRSTFNRAELYRRCSYSDANDNISELDSEEYSEDELYDNVAEYDDVLQPISIKNILNANSTDKLIIKLKNSASLQDVLNILHANHAEMNSEHISQAVLMLWDLQKLFYYFNAVNNLKDVKLSIMPEQIHEFVVKLSADEDFNLLLNLIKSHRDEFDTESLSCILLYLNKMGLGIKHDILQILIYEFKKRFAQQDYTLSSLSRFMVTVFKEVDLNSYLIIQQLIPTVFSQIALCSTAEDIKLNTICLNTINRLVTQETLEKYKEKVEAMIDCGAITANDHRAILKILLFLNYPQWRNKNCNIITKCIMVLKDNLNHLSVSELLILYEIFYKNQEPGDILNEIQRCASKHLQQLDEESNPFYDVRIKLMCCLVCFSTSSLRLHLDALLEKYIAYELSPSALIEFNKLLLVTKTANKTICTKFWDKVLKNLKESDHYRKENLLKICNYYVNFYQKVNQFRHRELESQVNSWIEEALQKDISSMIPAKLAGMACFTFAFGQNEATLINVARKISNNWVQLSHYDYFNISKGLEIAVELQNTKPQTKEILKNVHNDLEKYIENIRDWDPAKANILLKSFYDKGKNNELLDEKLISNYNGQISWSSKFIKNTSFLFQITDILLPDTLEQMCRYVAESNKNMLGFNVEKLIHVCYYLGYVPKDSSFYEAATNIILRDQERLSALSYIQAALGLCFFQALPGTFVKQIFNVEFLEKIDSELTNCYYKDVYPLRVRYSLMQLNRAVCLDYPETNVPWFHKSYIEDIKKSQKTFQSEFTIGVKQELSAIIGDVNRVSDNVYTPYGYHIDFEMDYGNSTKAAILLTGPKFYTKTTKQLKGQHQLKNRHLEMLGYKIIIINLGDWINIVHDKRASYLEAKCFS